MQLEISTTQSPLMCNLKMANGKKTKKETIGKQTKNKK